MPLKFQVIIPHKNKLLVFDFNKGPHMAQKIESFANPLRHILTSLTLDIV